MSLAELKAADFSERVSKLLGVSKGVGARRAAVRDQIRELPNGEIVLAVKYDNALTAINSEGEEVVVEKGERIEHIVHPSLRAEIGSAPGNKTVAGVVIPCGMCVIVGPGSSGKTPLAHALAASGDTNYAMVRTGEPLAGYASSAKEVSHDLAVAMLKYGDVVLDSIKDVLSSGSGAAMKSGINRDALTAISTWSAQACDLGTTIYVPLNPATPQEDVAMMMAEAAKSNATSCLIHKGGTKWEYFARTGEGLPRTHCVFDFGKNGEITVDGQSSPGSSEDEGRIATLIIDQSVQFNTTLSRLLRQKG